MPLLHPPLPGDLVTFNVRGRIFQTTLTALRRFPDSVLYKMVQYEQQRNRAGPREGSAHESFFIDRDHDLFDAVLRYHDTEEYVGGGYTGENPVPVVTRKGMLLEADYYSLPSLQKAIEEFNRLKGLAVMYECHLCLAGIELPPPVRALPTIATSWSHDRVTINVFAISAGEAERSHEDFYALNRASPELRTTISRILEEKDEVEDWYKWTLWSIQMPTDLGEELLSMPVGLTLKAEKI
jgi:hypothetical protein